MNELQPGVLVPPNASALAESLRAFGYSPQAAIADLIDNSITAEARNVWIHCEWAGEDSYVTIRDDGCGMDEDRLCQAMRAGSQSPTAERAPRDLGRFGLGMKTASFSQCRRMTVRSKRAGESQSTKRWDLDYIARTNDWWLLNGASPGGDDHLSALDDQERGTVVLWENLDRLTRGSSVGEKRAQARFLQLVEDVDLHLGMVFHRFIGRSLTLWLNGKPVEPWDPYLAGEPATQRLQDERLIFRDEVILVRPYVLPHHSRLAPENHSRAAGPAGWNAQQGFYVYRADRLLVAGGWLGLGFQQEEHYKLARIAVDLPNTVDHDWDLDVRKSRARPPGHMRDDLRRIARITRDRAADVYRHRGKIIARSLSQDHVFIWNRVLHNGRLSYRINMKHPLVAAVLESAGPTREAVMALLTLIQETIPVPTIVIDSSEHPDGFSSPFAEAPTSEVSAVLIRIYEALRRQGLSPAQARQRLITMDPFQAYVELIEALGDSASERTR